MKNTKQVHSYSEAIFAMFTITEKIDDWREKTLKKNEKHLNIWVSIIIKINIFCRIKFFHFGVLLKVNLKINIQE